MAISNPSRFLRRAALPGASVAILCAALFAAVLARSDEPGADSVGFIDGESISVTGPMRVEAVHGQVKTILRSGSDVRVKSGNARIDLVEGGLITICGPAHISVLKSGGSLTVALDSGTIHVHVEHEPSLTIYTPQLQVQTVAIGDGPQDALVGFETPGAMCIRANRGALRLEQQLTGQTILVPQAGDVVLLDGQLDSLRTGAGHCSCAPQLKKAPPPEPETSRLATTEEIRRQSLEAKSSTSSVPVEKLGVKEEPIYQVFMPPLVYDIHAKTQPDYDPKMIVLVRRVRVRPTLIFLGRVEGEAVAAVAPPRAPAASANASKPPAPAPPSDSLVERVRNFVRKLWSSES